MSISAIASTAPATLAPRIPEAAEGPGPDRDADADDKGVSGSQAHAAPQTLPGGLGSVVNTSA